MNTQKVLNQLAENVQTVLNQDSPLGILLWQEFLKIHPADSAQFLSERQKDEAQRIFTKLPHQQQVDVFSYFSPPMMLQCLSLLSGQQRRALLNSLPLDELTDFFDELSDQELKEYIKLLHKEDREKVLSMMQFEPDTAGGIMHTDVVTLLQDFTIEKSIQILQRLQPSVELHPNIYVTNQENQLAGHINLEDLVLRPPQTRLSSILRKNELVVTVDEDQEKIAHQMIHYNLMTVPVVGANDTFLGIIPSEELGHILEEEAAEDVYRISALRPIKHSYFETSFFRLIYQRSYILIALLLVQIFSSIIIERYENLLKGFLILFITMIQSTGGNSSSQSSALAIRGISTGEINSTNMLRFFRREMMMAAVIGVLLGLVSFVRVYFFHSDNLWGNISVSVALGVIVLVSSLLGSLIPVALRRLNLDPAFSAGPVLGTLMDILGLLIYCYIGQLFLGI